MVKYKFIKHEVATDSPFIGAVICAKGCKFKCKGCFNKDLKKLPDLKATAKEIIVEVKSNPFNEGIILGGLEWSEQPLDLIELAQEASDNGLKVMIYTGCDLKEFRERIGKACSEKYPTMMEANKDNPWVTGEGIYGIIGGMMLDYYITEDYYLKCGRYDETKLVADRKHFGISLASSNQNIFYIKKVEK